MYVYFFNFQAFYYIAIVEDFVLRFGWALSMSLTEMGYVHGDLMVSILSPLEVMRLVYHIALRTMRCLRCARLVGRILFSMLLMYVSCDSLKAITNFL